MFPCTNDTHVYWSGGTHHSINKAILFPFPPLHIYISFILFGVNYNVFVSKHYCSLIKQASLGWNLPKIV